MSKCDVPGLEKAASQTNMGRPENNSFIGHALVSIAISLKRIADNLDAPIISGQPNHSNWIHGIDKEPD